MIKQVCLLVLIGILFVGSDSVAQSINWMPLEEAQEQAAETGKKVFIYAEAEWCGYCKKMNKQVFPQQSVADSLSKYFHPVRIDIESDEKTVFNEEDFTEQVLAQKFRVTGTPTMIFIDSDGQILGTQPGFLKTEIFDKLLAYVGNDLFDKLEFKEYLNQHGVSVN